MKFPINSKCVVKSSIRGTGPFDLSKVIAHTEDGFIIIENQYGGTSKIAKANLLSEVDAMALHAVLKEEHRRYEEEFEALKLKMKDKMDQAAVLINEAQAMSTRGYSLQELYSESSNLADAISNAGWNTSTQSC